MKRALGVGDIVIVDDEGLTGEVFAIRETQALVGPLGQDGNREGLWFELADLESCCPLCYEATGRPHGDICYSCQRAGDTQK